MEINDKMGCDGEKDGKYSKRGGILNKRGGMTKVGKNKRGEGGRLLGILNFLNGWRPCQVEFEVTVN